MVEKANFYTFGRYFCTLEVRSPTFFSLQFFNILEKNTAAMGISDRDNFALNQTFT
jgi:hypothetical protein